MVWLTIAGLKFPSVAINWPSFLIDNSPEFRKLDRSVSLLPKCAVLITG